MYKVSGSVRQGVVYTLAYRSATFQVEEPSSCSKRWSEWAFVVIHKCPELQ
ncbi:unnamed protein product, partial [Brassica rapa]